MKKNGMSTEDKRGAFMAVGVVFTVMVFLAAASAIADKSWTPLILAAQISGITLGTLVFFYYVISALWIATERLFPTDKEK